MPEVRPAVRRSVKIHGRRPSIGQVHPSGREDRLCEADRETRIEAYSDPAKSDQEVKVYDQECLLVKLGLLSDEA